MNSTALLLLTYLILHSLAKLGVDWYSGTTELPELQLQWLLLV